MMRRLTMTLGTPATTAAFAVLLGFSFPLHGQELKTPDLSDVLQRLEANLRHYDTSVPNLFCDEHAISSRADHQGPEQHTVTDSVFRLRRGLTPDHRMTLSESREIKSVNGKASPSTDLDGPTLLTGMFEGGLAVVSLNQRPCMEYTLQRPHKKHPTQPYVVRFTTAAPPNSTRCFLQEESKGRAFVDPASMQVTHLEIETPHHALQDEDTGTRSEMGKREITVDYTPVSLGSAIFWMPSAINMRTSSGFGYHRTVWSFQATYRNFHRQEVTSRILPAGEKPAP